MSDEEYVDVSIAQDGGVLKKILQNPPEDAEGPPPQGNVVTAHYTGKFKNDNTIIRVSLQFHKS